jgi:hypothetical protein
MVEVSIKILVCSWDTEGTQTEEVVRRAGYRKAGIIDEDTMWLQKHLGDRLVSIQDTGERVMYNYRDEGYFVIVNSAEDIVQLLKDHPSWALTIKTSIPFSLEISELVFVDTDGF